MKILYAIIVAAILADPLQAAFTMRLGGGAQSQVIASGGTLIYETDAKVNGDLASVSVYSFRESSHSLGARFRRLRKIPATSDEGSWLTWRQGRRKIDLIILPGRTLNQSTAWLIQSRPDRRRSAPPPTPPIDFDPCPAANLDFWISLDNTKTVLLNYSSARLPSELVESASTSLERAGWTVLLPSSTQAVLTRNGRAGFVQALGGDGQTRLAILLQGAAF